MKTRSLIKILFFSCAQCLSSSAFDPKTVTTVPNRGKKNSPISNFIKVIALFCEYRRTKSLLCSQLGRTVAFPCFIKNIAHLQKMEIKLHGHWKFVIGNRDVMSLMMGHSFLLNERKEERSCSAMFYEFIILCYRAREKYELHPIASRVSLLRASISFSFAACCRHARGF